MILHFYFPQAFKILKIEDILIFYNQLISNMLDYKFAKVSQIQIETLEMMLLSMINLPNLLCTYKG